MALNIPSSSVDVVREIVGRRSRITRAEMAAILRRLEYYGADLRNMYVAATIDMADQSRASAQAPAAWAHRCRGITCISVDMRGRLRDGHVRYDEPGSMHPMQHAEITFVPADIDAMRSGDDGSTIAYMRRHADRVLLVLQSEPGPGGSIEDLTGAVCDKHARTDSSRPHPIAGGSDAPVKAPSLLDALLRLEQHAEGRRVARKALKEAAFRLSEALEKNLRVGDRVTVAGRVYRVSSRRSNIGSYEGLAVADRDDETGEYSERFIAEGGEYLHGDFHCRMAYASTEDLRHFADHAAEIVAAFADRLKADSEAMTAAAAQARTQRV